MRFYPVTTGPAFDSCVGCEKELAPGTPASMRQDGAKFCDEACGRAHGSRPLKGRRIREVVPCS